MGRYSGLAKESLRGSARGAQLLLRNLLKLIAYGSGFCVKDKYHSLRQNHPRIQWRKFNSPRDAIHAWLVAHDRLSTKDIMRKRGMRVPLENVCSVRMMVNLVSICFFKAEELRRFFSTCQDF